MDAGMGGMGYEGYAGLALLGVTEAAVYRSSEKIRIPEDSPSPSGRGWGEGLKI